MKKLIIVCEESCRPYGDYLAQLISMEDDTEESVVGVKDGEVAAQVWLEKDYTANAAQLSSNQYILFIGDDKFVKDKSMNMKVVFKKYGIAYGWLGRQAFYQLIVRYGNLNTTISLILHSRILIISKGSSKKNPQRKKYLQLQHLLQQSYYLLELRLHLLVHLLLQRKLIITKR